MQPHKWRKAVVNEIVVEARLALQSDPGQWRRSGRDLISHAGNHQVMRFRFSYDSLRTRTSRAEYFGWVQPHGEETTPAQVPYVYSYYHEGAVRSNGYYRIYGTWV